MFGTDGIRGPVGSQWVNPDCFYRLGFALSQTPSLRLESRRALVARDTRESGDSLQAAIVRGLREGGVDVIDMGVMPTPIVSYCTQHHEASLGLMITASHNPYTDNGLKLFTSDGGKLNHTQQADVMRVVQALDMPTTTDQLGAYQQQQPMDDYLKECVDTFAESVAGFKGHLICDCAHGATSALAPAVLDRLGLSHRVIHNQPTGTNINLDCGSMSMVSLREAVLADGADLGVAFDGDGDRVLMLDSDGELIDGDDMLLALVRHQQLQGASVPGVVGTVMTNEALAQMFDQEGVPFQRAAVGDRHVVEALKENGWTLGSEPSGHVVNLQYANTGDGLMTLLQWLALMAKTQQSASAIRQQLKKFPQVLINVPIQPRYDMGETTELVALQTKISQALGKEGRLLLRPSGTEPVIRVMVEGAAHLPLQDYAEQLAGCIKDENKVL